MHVRSQIRANNLHKKEARVRRFWKQTGNLASDEFRNNKTGWLLAYLFSAYILLQSLEQRMRQPRVFSCITFSKMVCGQKGNGIESADQ
jgi:hypothetical protein